jgi:hypothetical protein
VFFVFCIIFSYFAIWRTQRRLVAEHETAAAELQSMIEKLAFDKLQIEAARDEVRIGMQYNCVCLSVSVCLR